jgi:hypothetical protein
LTRLEAIGEIAGEYGLWYHIDGAYGAFFVWRILLGRSSGMWYVFAIQRQVGKNKQRPAEVAGNEEGGLLQINDEGSQDKPFPKMRLLQFKEIFIVENNH